MKFFSWSVWNTATLLGLVSLFWLSCTAPAPRWKWMVMTTDLVKDSAMIRIYDSMHSVKGVWPELTKANKASGIEEIRIYRFDNRLVMMLRIPEGADLKKMDSLYVGADPKVAIWGRLMNGFQRSLPGMDSTRKWVEMSLVHHYEGGAYLEK